MVDPRHLADDIPTLHEIVDLAEDFNAAMERGERDAARTLFAVMDNSTIELRTYLIALDLVRDYWGQLGTGDDVRGGGMIKQSEINRRVRGVLDANPDLPILLLTSNCYGDDFDSHYHDPDGARAAGILFPSEVEELYGDAFGLEQDRWYEDAAEVAERIEECWLWDGGHGAELQRLQGTRTIVPKEWAEVYRPIAGMMAADMPWHEYVVIYGE